MSGVVANVWRFFVFIVAGAIVLGMLGINLTPLLASATIIGATLGFGAQQIVRDYFSGILMTMEDQYNVGDSVSRSGGVTGVVEEVTMRLTRFRGADGTIFVIPNGDIRLVGNLSRGWARAIVDLTLPGAGAADLETVRARDRARRRTRWQREPAFAGHCTEPPILVGLQYRRLDDDHHARDAADHSVAARPADAGPARGDAGGAGEGRRSGRAWPTPPPPPPRLQRRPPEPGPGPQSRALDSAGSAASAACHMASTGAAPCPSTAPAAPPPGAPACPRPSTRGARCGGLDQPRVGRGA